MKNLKDKTEFDFVYKNSKKYDGGGFSSYILTFSHPALRERRFSFKERAIFSRFLSSNQEFYLGLSVSKKVGNAPMRNKIKRWFRAFCRIHHDLLVGKAIVFVARDVTKMEYAVIEQEMTRVLKKK